jgi:hypothetical protein
MTEMLLPKDGGVLVSHPTATRERRIAIVPGPPHIVCATYTEAVACAVRMAHDREVDAWLTEDLRNFLRVAACRP